MQWRRDSAPFDIVEKSQTDSDDSLKDPDFKTCESPSSDISSESLDLSPIVKRKKKEDTETTVFNSVATSSTEESANVMDSNIAGTSLPVPEDYTKKGEVRKRRKFNKSLQERKQMKEDDFFNWPDNSSIYKINNLNPRPYLKDIVQVVAQRGKYVLYYKTSFSSETLLELNFLKAKSFKWGLRKPPIISGPRGIKGERKQMILQNLKTLIPENRRKFWEHLPVNDAAADLRTDYDNE